MSHCGVYKCLPHDPSIHSPRGLPAHSRPGFPHVGNFSCPLLLTISNGTLRTIHLASNTARRPACSFHPDDQASLKLAELQRRREKRHLKRRIKEYFCSGFLICEALFKRVSERPDYRDENCRLVGGLCCSPGGSLGVCRKKLLGAVDTRRYPRAENRVWSDQEDHEERGSKDRAASTSGPHSDSFNDTSRRRCSNCSTNNFAKHLAEANLKSKRSFHALHLTPEHWQLRLHLSQKPDPCGISRWQKVVFSDESRFCFGD
ncbi:HTH_Tnp_Tc3_2 domain-containing protein [Trichonephila clavipes]|nr:HTH_Tnp_Tc3_2 domain-containing protein [Trichonephila clavipes]